MTGEDLRGVAALLEVGRWEAAQRLLGPLMARHPASPRLACLMARCHHQARDWGAMLAEAQRACALAPDDGQAHRLRSIALRCLTRPAEATAAAREAARLEPQLWQPFVVLAEALLAGGDRRSRLAARDAVRQALTLAPDHAEVRITAARVQSALGDTRGARAHYEQVLAGSPEHAVARNNLAVLDLHRSRTTAAAEQVRAAVAAEPGNPLFARNAQLTATLWLGRLQKATSAMYLICWLTAAILPSPVPREVLAALVAVGTVSATGLAYRRLPPGIARLVRWPSIALVQPHGLRKLRRTHLIVMGLAVVQVGAAVAVLLTRWAWNPLLLVASSGVVMALIRSAHGWIRALSRLERRWASRRG